MITIKQLEKIEMPNQSINPNSKKQKFLIIRTDSNPDNLVKEATVYISNSSNGQQCREMIKRKNGYSGPDFIKNVINFINKNYIDNYNAMENDAEAVNIVSVCFA